MANNPWFRLYSEAVDDEKLRLLAFEDRWHFIALLCCKNNGILDTEPALMRRKVAVKLGLDLRELGEVGRRLSEVGLIDEETLQPVKWDDRQFKSDSSTKRVQEYRNKMKRSVSKGETDLKQQCNVSETAQEEDTDTDTEKETLNTGVLLFPQPEKKKKATHVPKDFEVTEQMFDWAVSEGLPQNRIRPETEQFLDRSKSKGATYLDWNAAWRTWMRNAVKFARVM